MKKIIGVILFLLLLTGCGNQMNEKTTSNESRSDVNQLEKTAVVYYSLTNNTEEVAQSIHEQTGAPLFKIEPTEPYPTSYGEVEGLVREQQQQNVYPDLEALAMSLEDYDLILLGSPTWHGQISQPVKKWLMDTDLSGKKIAPFFTSGSQPIEDPIGDLSEWVPREKISQELSMANSPREDIDSQVEEWLSQIKLED